MTCWGFLFPGQGSQEVGMGKALAEHYSIAKDTFAEADDVLGYKLSKLCMEGPAEELRQTEKTQPALLTVSIAAVRSFLQEFGSITPICMAGHSLGEWAALVQAGALSFADAVNLVRWRGYWMQQAVPPDQGAMAAIIGLSESEVEQICKEAQDEQVCTAANFNAPTQIVISGDAAAIQRAIKLAKDRGKRAIPLTVSAPFHCALMQPAADHLVELIENTAFYDCLIPVISNVDAQPYTQSSEVRKRLIRQITSPVRWTESIQQMIQLGVEQFIELGHGRVLSGLLKHIDRTLPITSLGTPKDIEQFVSRITTNDTRPSADTPL
jgi:[acyl-carrier-protein] S-malonyltransferase